MSILILTIGKAKHTRSLYNYINGKELDLGSNSSFLVILDFCHKLNIDVSFLLRVYLNRFDKVVFVNPWHPLSIKWYKEGLRCNKQLYGLQHGIVNTNVIHPFKFKGAFICWNSYAEEYYSKYVTGRIIPHGVFNHLKSVQNSRQKKTTEKLRIGVAVNPFENFKTAILRSIVVKLERKFGYVSVRLHPSQMNVKDCQKGISLSVGTEEEFFQDIDVLCTLSSGIVDSAVRSDVAVCFLVEFNQGLRGYASYLNNLNPEVWPIITCGEVDETLLQKRSSQLHSLNEFYDYGFKKLKSEDLI